MGEGRAWVSVQYADGEYEDLLGQDREGQDCLTKARSSVGQLKISLQCLLTEARASITR